MPSHRSLRMAEAIREVVSSAILFEVADPRVRAVTVLGVEVSGDLRHASVAVSIMGTDAEQDLAFKGLRSATGFLQSRVAARLQTRFTPTLTFQKDDSVKKSIAISKLIDAAIAEDRLSDPAARATSNVDLDAVDAEDEDEDEDEIDVDVDVEHDDDPDGRRPDAGRP